MKFNMKLWCYKGKKVTELGFSDKISFFPKYPKIRVFWSLQKKKKKKKNRLTDVIFFWLHMMNHNCLYGSVKIACLGKIWVSSYK